MADVLVTENIVGDRMEALRRTHDVLFEPGLWNDPDRIVSLIADVRALIVRNQTRVSAELIGAAKHLRIIARAGAGLDNIDVQAATDAGVVVSFTPSQNSISVAELTVGVMLDLARKISAADRHVKQGGWDRRSYTGVELYGKVLGVVGFGRIGFLTAMRAKNFGMDVVAYDPYVDDDAMAATESGARMVELDELCGIADFVTCHLPCDEKTCEMFNYERFCRMKPGAFFINVARGEVVEEEGLVRALEEKKIAGAALDVRRTEPPELGPLEEMDNVVLMPHVGAFTNEAQQRVVASVCRDVATVLEGGRAGTFVNFPIPKNM